MNNLYHSVSEFIIYSDTIEIEMLRFNSRMIDDLKNKHLLQ
jgi:hypothetical protein